MTRFLQPARANHPRLCRRPAGTARRLRGSSLIVSLSLVVSTLVTGFAGGKAGADPSAEIAPGTWSAASDLGKARVGHTASLLKGPECGRPTPPAYCGNVLVVGGSRSSEVVASAEVYDPVTRRWAASADLLSARSGHTATLLDGPPCRTMSPADWCGHVLVVGGVDGSGKPMANAEDYEPATFRVLPDGSTAQGVWSPTGSLATPRSQHTATLLADGRVLVTGGRGESGTPLATAEVFDPRVSPPASPWRGLASMSAGRAGHTATQLASGQILVAGGGGPSGALATTELFDPTSGAWRSGPPMGAARSQHTATRLPGGAVLVVGAGPVELFDPAGSGGSGAWRATPPMTTSRTAHTATLVECRAGDTRPHCGTVVVAGGMGPSGAALSSAEVFDPVAGTWAMTGNMIGPRGGHSATLLQNGLVLADGGAGGGGPLASAELFDPTSVAQPPSVTDPSPTGGPVGGGTQVKIVGAALLGATEVRFGDRPAGGLVRVSNTELRVASPPQGSPVTVPVVVVTPAGASAPTNRSRFRYAPAPTVTRIDPSAGPPSGGTSVTITGTTLDFPDTTVLFGDVAAAIAARSDTQLTVVSPPHSEAVVDVTVVTPGGRSEPTFASLFTFGDGAWEKTASLAVARYHHTATMLRDGRVMATGGTANFDSNGSALASTEMYDPATGTWAPAAPMREARFSHTATLLDGPACRASSPASWCGRVLVVGGQRQLASGGGWEPVGGAELYDPVADRWAPAGELREPRFSHTATLLDGPDCRATRPPPYCGKVLVVGGTDSETGGRPPRRTTELYDPADGGSWSLTGPLDPGCTAGPCGRTNHTATLLPNGRVLVAGGIGADPSAPLARDLKTSNVGMIDGVSSNEVRHVITSPPKTAPSVRLVVTASPPAGSPVAPGDRITYTIRYFNIGGRRAERVDLSMIVPPEVDFVSATGGGIFGDARRVTFPTVAAPAGTTVAAPAGTFEVTAAVRECRLAPRNPTCLSPDAAAIPAGAIVARFDVGDEQNVAAVTHTLDRPTDLHVALGADPIPGSFVAPGSLITYSLAAFNTGRAVGEAVKITDRLPEEVDFVSASAGGTFDPDQRTVKFPPLSVPPGTTSTAPAAAYEVSLRAREARPDGSTIFDKTVFTNVAGINGLSSNPVSHTVLRAAPAAATVRLAESASPPPGSTVPSGGLITYTLAYFNAGGATATEVVSVTFSESLRFISASGGGTPTTAQKVTFPPVEIPGGTTARSPAGTFEVTVEVIGQSGTTLTSQGTISNGGLSNLVAHTSVEVSPLRIVKSADPPAGSPVRPGEQITYALDYFNAGTARVDGAVVSDRIDDQMVFVSAGGGGAFDPVTRKVTFPTTSVPAGTTATAPAGRFSITVASPAVTGPISTAEVFDPAAGAWSAVGSLSVARFDHTATVLDTQPCADRCGKVLVAGGADRITDRDASFTSTAELFDPATGRWSPTGVQDASRAGHTASVLPDGTVLVAGGAFGFPVIQRPGPLAGAEIYDPARGTWRDTASMGEARGIHTATVLSGPRCSAPGAKASCGSVLAAGGGTNGPGQGSGRVSPPALAAAEVYSLPRLAPSVQILSPATGPSSGGTTVTITGAGFDDARGVSFGDVPAARVEVFSRRQLKAVSPPLAPGVVAVRVTAAEGTSAGTARARFTSVVSQAPGRVNDLAARAVSNSEIELSFSAPPSDGMFPPPSGRFIVKQASSPIIDEAGFGAAATICGGVCTFSPTAVGQRLTLTVADLDPATTQHYALRALNEIAMVGAISNPASAATAGTRPAQEGAASPAMQAAGVTPLSAVGVRRTAPGAPPAQATPAAVPIPPASAGPSPSGNERGPEASRPLPPLAADQGGANVLGVLLWVLALAGLAALGAYANLRFRGT